MPYLHWEISGRQEKFAREIDKIVRTSAKVLAETEASAKQERQKVRAKLPRSSRARDDIPQSPQVLPPERKSIERNIEEVEDVVDNVMANSIQNQGTKEDDRFNNTTDLGRYLLDAARLHENMATYRDRMLLRKYLPQDPPIHPRRTLDQAYYWTLKSTKRRDKDQVLYRGTTVAKDAFHRHDEENQCPEHKELKGMDCSICRSNISKVSRVVMVDQLWMWVLDKKTLITCFPKRYGANRQDYSGVHKSIRNSIDNLDSNQIHTVFELALIVLDECTTTFFNRTKSLDRRPQVVDEFSKAIGKIMHKQSVAFDRLWKWTDDARGVFRSQAHTNTKGLHIPLLDINPEGQLDREIGDIIEELDIMLRIANIHRDTVKSFVEQAERILDSEGSFRKVFEHNPPSMEKVKKDSNYEDYKSFKMRGDECQDRINRHVKDLESLRTSAKNTADGVLHLLTMKQQQAGVVQAWQAVKQSDETVKQYRPINPSVYPRHNPFLATLLLNKRLWNE
ncbi:hypothetical protein GGS24DRAFT_513762 [Hypoxylon argillaceum]|nr:hypothetical protein GGS24DRAFT_513762 [Hypoxylon argillaceum]